MGRVAFLLRRALTHHSWNSANNQRKKQFVVVHPVIENAHDSSVNSTAVFCHSEWMRQLVSIWLANCSVDPVEREIGLRGQDKWSNENFS